MQAWSHVDMLGDQSYFMNALLTCLDDEEEEMVKRTLFKCIYSYFIVVVYEC
jgi:23S rRNA maturation mini-RNase III